MWILKTGSFV